MYFARRRLAELVVIASMLLAGAAHAEIYRWVDEHGVTHFSEKAPPEDASVEPAGEVEEVSGELAREGNFTPFSEVEEIEYFRPERAPRIARVAVNIETFDFELTRDELARIEEQVRGLYQAYVRWFGWPAQPSQPISIKIFGPYAAFEQYQIETRGRFITNRSFYSPYHREILMLGSSFSDQTLQVLLHEASHAVMDMQVRRSSKWFNEGLACLFEGMVWRNNQIRFRASGWRGVMQHKLREGSLRPVNEYLNIPDRSWGSESGRVENMYYMIAWSIVRFFTSSEKGMQAMAEALMRQRRFSDQPGELVQIVGTTYPGGIERLDADWRRWIASL